MMIRACAERRIVLIGKPKLVSVVCTYMMIILLCGMLVAHGVVCLYSKQSPLQTVSGPHPVHSWIDHRSSGQDMLVRE